LLFHLPALTSFRASILLDRQRSPFCCDDLFTHYKRLLLDFRYENQQGRSAANAETLAGGFVRLVQGASTTNSPNNQAGALWFVELLPVGEGFIAEFEFRLSDAMQHCRVSSPSQVFLLSLYGCGIPPRIV